MTVPRGFTRCDECEGDRYVSDTIRMVPCPSCSGSGLLPTEKLREEAREASHKAWSDLFPSSATVNDVLLAQADAVLRKVAEHIRGGQRSEVPPCEWEQCGDDSVTAIVGEAGDIWLCPKHHAEWIEGDG